MFADPRRAERIAVSIARRIGAQSIGYLLENRYQTLEFFRESGVNLTDWTRWKKNDIMAM